MCVVLNKPKFQFGPEQPSPTESDLKLSPWWFTYEKVGKIQAKNNPKVTNEWTEAVYFFSERDIVHDCEMAAISRKVRCTFSFMKSLALS